MISARAHKNELHVPRLRRWARAEWAIPVLALALLGTIASPHVTQAEDDRQATVTDRAASLQDAINLFRERAGAGRRYDPFTDGWGPLIEAGYLRTTPVNPITGSERIVRQASGCAGWVYDSSTGRLDACGIDPETFQAGPLRRTR
jgi:hypothetical protein